jgi:Tol biopolymer transport system component
MLIELARRTAAGAALLAMCASPACANAGATDELLFLSNRANNVFEYYRMLPGAMQARRVLVERGEVSQMSWSPDGSQVLYLAARGRPFQSVYVTSLVDGKTRQLTQDQAPVSEPTWSPDGKRIAFVAPYQGPRRIQVMDANGANRRVVTAWRAQDEISPRFSPDGRRIGFLAALEQDTPPRLSVVDLDSGKTRMVSDYKGRGTESPPAWSPDGSKLLISATRSQQAQLVAVAADGSGSVDLTKGDARHTDGQWSPDGRQVLYLAIPGNSARQALFLMNADGGHARKLHGGNHDVMGARWSADGKRIYFVEHLDAGGKIFSIDASGQDLRRLSGEEGFDIDARPCCLARSPRAAEAN